MISSEKDVFLLHFPKKHHLVHGVLCPVCAQHQSSLPKLYTHLNICDTQGVNWGCNACGYTLGSLSRAIGHCRAKHPNEENPFECDVCGKKFAQKYQLTRHEPLHRSKEFHCLVKGCHKSYPCAPSLKQHTLLGHLNDEHKCQVKGCKKSYKRLFDLKTHVRGAHGKGYPCRFCEKPHTWRKLRDQHENSCDKRPVT
jgi:KRAB domain-containing zinc finger protein